MKTSALVLLLLCLPLGAQAAEPSAASSPPAAPKVAAPLTIKSTVGELIDNPKTDAVLKKIIPDVRSNGMFDTAGRDLVLSEIGQYEPEVTSEKLKAISDELAKVQTLGATLPSAAANPEPKTSPPQAPTVSAAPKQP